jgi:hypothetical protein
MEMMSMFDYLGKKAGGSNLGKELYDFAKSKKAKITTREIKNKSYEGKVLVYERELLEEFFKNKEII